MKIKLETSPHTYASNEEYAKGTKQKKNIDLNLKNIIADWGKKAVVKLCLNSLWGKFGQPPNMGTTKYISDACRFYEVLLDDRSSDLNIQFINDEILQVTYKYKDYFVENNHNTSIFVTIYITSNAQLRLYNHLNKLKECVLYCDTDSIVYKNNGNCMVKTADMLGEWTDELGDNIHIVKWLATGPKSYYYKTNKGKETIKVKGFTLNYKNAINLNAKNMEKVLDGELDKIIVTSNQIIRDVNTKHLVNKERGKMFSFRFDKRIIAVDFDTVSYGYVQYLIKFE